MLSGSELWLLRLMADRGLALLDANGLLIVVEQSGELQVAATSGDARVQVRVLPVEGSALGALYQSHAPLSLENPRGPEAAWLYELGLEARAIVVEPLQMNQQGGLIVALRRQASFSSVDRDALRAFAASVAQRLVAERSVEIERLRHGMEARERERTRWAREIHDETVQGLAALRLMLANARDMDEPGELRAAVDAVLEGLGAEIDGLRHLITELRPAALDDLGLVPALEALARRTQAIDGVVVEAHFGLDGGAERRLDSELESTIYRVVQEALTNVGRHAHAERAWIDVTQGDEELHVSVSDDGRGLDAGQAAGDTSGGGFGLSGMRERAELVGAELSVRPQPGGGTTVALVVPLAGRPQQPLISR